MYVCMYLSLSTHTHTYTHTHMGEAKESRGASCAKEAGRCVFTCKRVELGDARG